MNLVRKHRLSISLLVTIGLAYVTFLVLEGGVFH